jgi:hypothetical protein
MSMNQTLMQDELRALMKSIENTPDAAVETANAELRFAARAGLGSKYLAVGTPTTLGLVNCDAEQEALIACHELLFGPLEVLRSADTSIEEAMAADIVCLPTTAIFELDWIAEATHLNIMTTGPWSEGMQQLATCTALTYLNAATAGPGVSHGLLSEVIHGSVSGRMGEEITALVA